MKKFINPSAILYVVMLVVITLLIVFASGSNKTVKENPETSTSQNTGITPNNISTENSSTISTTTLKAINNNTMNNTKTNMITMQTSLGNIQIELYPDKAPKTVANFIKLANSNFYDGTKFHRVIKGFMIQGGDPYTKGEDTSVYGTGGPGYKFDDEINDLPMVSGMLAMANSGPNTNGSQFFIITASSTPWLVGHHTVFGKVISGMDVVTAIENSKTGPNDLPLTPVIVAKMTVK